MADISPTATASRLALVTPAGGPADVPADVLATARALFSATPTERIRRDAHWTAHYLTGPAGAPPDTRALPAELSVAAVPTDLLDGPGLVVMDVDSTFITAEVVDELAGVAGTRTEVAAVTARAMRGEIDFAESLRARVATLAGIPVGVLSDLVGRLAYSPGAAELVAAVRARGGRVGLVSGGFVEVIGPLAAPLGIDLIAANRLEIVAGRLTGRVVGEIIDAAGKARHLAAFAQRLGLPMSRTVAVGDGANDIAMIEAAGLGVAYCAKPVLVERAPARVTFARLDALCGLLDL